MFLTRSAELLDAMLKLSNNGTRNVVLVSHDHVKVYALFEKLGIRMNDL